MPNLHIFTRTSITVVIGLFLIFGVEFSDTKKSDKCRDTDMNCGYFLAGNPNACFENEVVMKHCQRSCEYCGPPISRKYDVRLMSPRLKEVAWMVGRWRSEFGGKAFFPTIPKFSYGEQIDITIGDSAMNVSSLNYTAFAWDISQPDGDPVEIHSENGYITAKEIDNKTIAGFTTAMSNGFMTVEEGEVASNQVRFRLNRIGRINFSHDSAVLLTIREWTLLDEESFEARFLMATTITRRLQEHTYIVYKKIYP